MLMEIAQRVGDARALASGTTRGGKEKKKGKNLLRIFRYGFVRKRRRRRRRRRRFPPLSTSTTSNLLHLN